jgi:hypothetical protein
MRPRYTHGNIQRPGCLLQAIYIFEGKRKKKKKKKKKKKQQNIIRHNFTFRLPAAAAIAAAAAVFALSVLACWTALARAA